MALTAGAYETTIYVGGILEKVTRGAVTEYRHLIAGGKGIAAIYTRPSTGSPATYYVHNDHLGSPELITNASGAQVLKLSFGAYGERRGSNWTGTPSSGDWTAIGNTMREGFTGHEQLDSVGLIHMGGRVYDPVVGRFLSADPIAVLGSGQGANSYAYVMNNPLNAIDPSGYMCEPPSGMTEDEAQEYSGRCNAEYEGAGWGQVAQNERWCASSDYYCQQANWAQTLASLVEARDYADRFHGSGPSTPTGAAGQAQEIVVTGSRYGGIDRFDWATYVGLPAGTTSLIAASFADGSTGRVAGSATSTGGNTGPRIAGQRAGGSSIMTGASVGGGLGLISGAIVGVAYGLHELPASLAAASSVDGAYGVILAAGAFSDVGGYAMVGIVTFTPIGVVAGAVVVGSGIYLYHLYQSNYGRLGGP